MGQFKSDYDLNYRWISPTIRRKIWEDNYKMRLKCRNRNADHINLSWSDGEDKDDDGERMVGSPLAKEKLQPDEEEMVSSLPPTRRRLKFLKLKKQRQESFPFNNASKSMPNLAETSPKALIDSPPQEEDVQIPLSPSKATQTGEDLSEPKSARLASIENKLRARSRSARTKSSSVQTNYPTTVFGPYGLADRAREISGKRTFNVRASTKAIYPTALMAKQFRSMSSYRSLPFYH